MEKGPVFIGGVERSGTSLLFALLASHPNLAMTRRTNLWPYFYNQYGSLQDDGNLDRCLEAMKHFRRLDILCLDYDQLRSDFTCGPREYSRLFEQIWLQVAGRLGKPRWGDKSLNTERYANTIFAAYPGARILHIIRDPRDRYASALKRWKKIRGGPGSGTAMWLASVNEARRFTKLYPDQYRVVLYEQLAAHPEDTMIEICEFIGEEFTPEMMTMKGAEAFRDEGGNSSFEPREPGKITSHSIGRYSKVLSEQAVAFMQLAASKDMKAYGYAPSPVKLSLREQLKFSLIDLPLNFFRMTSWFARESYLNRVGRSIPADRILP